MRQTIFTLLTLALLFASCDTEDSNSEGTVNSQGIEVVKIEDKKEVVQGIKFIVSDKAFYGIEVKDPIANHTEKLFKSTTENGEGTFEVYDIKDEEGKVLGQVYPDPLNESLVGDIVIRSKEVSTEKGVKIGMTFEELKAKFNNYKVHGSEIESRVHFYQGNHAYRLDHASNQYNLDESEIPADAKVIEITIMRISDL